MMKAMGVGWSDARGFVRAKARSGIDGVAR